MLIYGALALFFLWLLIISLVVYKLRKHYYGLTSHTKKHNIDDILDSIVQKNLQFETEIDTINKTVKKIIAEAKVHYQKIGFLRFNPFERVGGEQSFVISLLDHDNSGIILTFLYTREGVRIYAKRIKEGRSEEYELSAEEKEAIKKAT